MIAAAATIVVFTLSIWVVLSRGVKRGRYSSGRAFVTFLMSNVVAWPATFIVFAFAAAKAVNNARSSSQTPYLQGSMWNADGALGMPFLAVVLVAGAAAASAAFALFLTWRRRRELTDAAN